jgi:hypothetical protein
MVKLKKMGIKTVGFKKFVNWEIPLTLFLFGFLIIVVISIVYFGYYPKNIINKDNRLNKPLKELSNDGENISDIILSEGYPKNWESDLPKVVRIGIFEDNKINQDKLDKFYNLVAIDYPKTKVLFGTRYDYAFCLPLLPSGTSVMNISTAGGWIHKECIGGKDSVANIPSTARNLFKVTRFTIYENKPVTANIYVWE